jgi:hypothetical protein
MLGVERTAIEKSEVENLITTYPHLFENIKRFPEDRNIYSSGAIKMATNVKTHLQINFDKVLKKYLYNTASLTKEEAVNVLINLWGWKKDYNQGKNVNNEKVKTIINKLRSILKIEDNEIINKAWLKKLSNLPTMLKFFIYVNRIQQDNKQPLINILPINKIKMHHLTIDSTTLYGVLKEIGLETGGSENKKGHNIWNGVFDFERIMGKGRNFTFTIDTDGVSMSAHFWKRNKKKEKHQKEYEIAKNNGNLEEWLKQQKQKNSKKTKPDLTDKRVFGGDPGRTNILTLVEVLGDGTIKKYTLTRKQYYNDSGIDKANRKVQKWNACVATEIKLLSSNSPKSVVLTSFLEYVETKKNIDNALWQEYTKKRWQEQRFRLYGGKKRVFSKFFNQLGDPKDIVIAYGSAKLAPGGKGEVSVPVSRIYKECASRYDTYIEDEYRSSKYDWRYETVLQLVKSAKTNRSIRGLLWCNSTNNNECKFVDRDVNAAMNIRKTFMSVTRPVILSRSRTNVVTEQTIGKIIKR